jgi:LmbE family N-acetylglucosaminyl deacetylase
MSIREKRILCVSAHPDDLEVMAGGSVSKWVKEGHHVHAITFPDGAWANQDGKWFRGKSEGILEERHAADYLGYSVENLGYPAMDISYTDAHVVELLNRASNFKPDVLLCPWDGDLHHDHEVVSRIAFSAARRIPTFLMGQGNYYLRHMFVPNVFVDITDTWDNKIEALKCYTSEWGRAARDDWMGFLDATSIYYGKIIGVKRAEGFVSRRLLW